MNITLKNHRHQKQHLFHDLFQYYSGYDSLQHAQSTPTELLFIHVHVYLYPAVYKNNLKLVHCKYWCQGFD